MTFSTFFTTVYDFLLGQRIWDVLIRVGLALFMGCIIGMERGKQGRAAGMRTHILVCVGAALTSMTGEFAYHIFNTGDPMRVAAQVISGIGFLGVGTIVVRGKFQITGLTTAAGLWAAAAIGLSLGIGFYVGAVIVFVATVATMTLIHRFEHKLTHKGTRYGVYIEIVGTKDVRTIINHLSETYRVSDIQVTPARSGTAGNVGIESIIHTYGQKELTPNALIEQIESLEEVVFAMESI